MPKKQALKGHDVALLPPRQTNLHGNTTLVTKQPQSADEWSDVGDAEDSLEQQFRKIKAPVFHRLEWSDPQLGTLSALPDELVAEICTHLIPLEIPGIVSERDTGQFRAGRNNILNFMQASSRLYNISRES